MHPRGILATAIESHIDVTLSRRPAGVATVLKDQNTHHQDGERILLTDYDTLIVIDGSKVSLVKYKNYDLRVTYLGWTLHIIDDPNLGNWESSCWSSGEPDNYIMISKVFEIPGKRLAGMNV